MTAGASVAAMLAALLALTACAGTGPAPAGVAAPPATSDTPAPLMVDPSQIFKDGQGP